MCMMRFSANHGAGWYEPGENKGRNLDSRKDLLTRRLMRRYEKSKELYLWALNRYNIPRI